MLCTPGSRCKIGFEPSITAVSLRPLLPGPLGGRVDGGVDRDDAAGLCAASTREDHPRRLCDTLNFIVHRFVEKHKRDFARDRGGQMCQMSCRPRSR